jgi:CBS domain-containing protein
MGAEPLAVWLEPLPVHELMHAPVATVTPDTPACEAARLLGTRKIRHLPVVDHDGRLVGIVTDRDLRQAVFHPAVQARLGTMLRALEAALRRLVRRVRPLRDVPPPEPEDLGVAGDLWQDEGEPGDAGGSTP